MDELIGLRERVLLFGVMMGGRGHVVVECPRCGLAMTGTAVAGLEWSALGGRSALGDVRCSRCGCEVAGAVLLHGELCGECAGPVRRVVG